MTAARPGVRWRRTIRRIRNGQNGYNCGVYVDPQNPDLVYTINTSSYHLARRRQHVHRLQGRARRRRSAADVDRSDQRQAHVPRRRSGRDRVARRRAHVELVVQPGDRRRSTTSRPTTRIRTGSTRRSRTPARSRTRSRGDLGAITPLDWYPTAGLRVRLDRRRSAQSEDRLRRRTGRRHREDHVSERAVDQREPERRRERRAAQSRQPADCSGRRPIRTSCSSGFSI